MFPRVVRTTTWLVISLASLAVLLVAVAAGWLFLYTSDVPDILAMNSFAPETPTTVTDTYICGEKTMVQAVPTHEMTYVRDALFAAEGEIDEGGLFRRFYDDVNLETEARKHYGHYSLQLSRQLFCDDHRQTWRRNLFEIRTSIQLERHFTKSQLLDIYLNRTFFGSHVYGIENASEHYLAKPANQLSLPDAALLIGLIKNPSVFSPLTHPDRALARRNEVIDAMSARGSITPEQAEQAKASPLDTLTHVKPAP